MQLHRQTRVRTSLWLLGLLLLTTATVRAVEDGLGTNYVSILHADGIVLDGDLRTEWPSQTILDSIGGTVRFGGLTNAVYWAPAIRGDGELGTARLLVDDGEAEVIIVRANWNDAWDTYDEILSLTVDTTGTSSQAWLSSWVSNQFRVGVIVTNYTTGTNLWWSVDYTR